MFRNWGQVCAARKVERLAFRALKHSLISSNLYELNRPKWGHYRVKGGKKRREIKTPRGIADGGGMRGALNSQYVTIIGDYLPT